MAGLVIPPRLSDTVVQWEGERGRAWLADLPRLVSEVRQAWDLELGPPCEPGGQISWVAPARRNADGALAVLKLQLPHLESDSEATGLAAWDGDGAVRLLAHDPSRCALLLERCRPGTNLHHLGGTDEAVRVGAAIGRRLHAAIAPPGVPALANVLDEWADELEERLVLPYVDPGLERLVLVTMRERPRACTRQVLLHGDLNPTNVLAAQREPWLAIDPKPMVGDPAFDGPRLVTQPDPASTADPAATLRRRLDIVHDVMRADRDALALWCLADTLQMGATARWHDDLAAARRFAALVALVAAEIS